MSKLKSFWDEYDELIKNTDRWCYYPETAKFIDSQNIFDNENSTCFIENVFKQGRKTHALDAWKYEGFKIEDSRAKHTVSAFLLGVLIRDKLNISMTELPKLNDKPTKTFLYFWSLICLYHDFAFSMENCSSEIGVYSFESFKTRFNIEYSLEEESNYGDLIKNYFEYRINVETKIDHGIAGAMFIYDGLMKEYYAARAYKGIDIEKNFQHDGLKYSRDYKRHAVMIANTIARHNMWIAGQDKEDKYKKYGLESLIAKDNNSHIISISAKDIDVKDKLLFLLGLVDTIEPIKCMGRNENAKIYTNAYLITEKMKVKFCKNPKAIVIKCDSSTQYSDYCNSIYKIGDWLDVSLETNDRENIIKIIVN